MADFVWRLTGTADRHAPIKQLSPKDVKRRINPWMTPQILKLIKIRDRLFVRKKKEPDNVLIKRTYNQARNRVNRSTQKAKKEYYNSYFEEHNTNIKKTWEGIKKIVNVKKSTNFSISHLNIKGKIADDPASIVNHFNHFFTNVGPETEKSVPRVPNKCPSIYLKNRNAYDLIITHISEEEVLDLINSLANKSSGPASIPLRLLKLVADLIVAPLCYIINISFSTGVFPNILKVAKVVPRHKGGSTP